MNGYRYQWALFVDWCAAADASALPASPVTLAEFLDDNPPPMPCKYAGSRRSTAHTSMPAMLHPGAPQPYAWSSILHAPSG